MANQEHADKRTVSTDALETLGTIIGPNEARDAIHLAVEPVEAAHGMNPGEHVGLDVAGKAFVVEKGDPRAVGIVDPFLKAPVCFGERFWLVVYPRQIKSLRHVWEHPAFPPSRDLTPAAKPVVRQPNHMALEAERWLRDFCGQADCPGYEAVMAEATRHVRDGGQYDEVLHFDGRDAHGEIPQEFWDNFEIVTGTKVHVDSRAGGFSCSC